VAAHYVESILKRKDVNGDVSKVPLVWFTGSAKGVRSAAGDLANPTVSVAQYQNEWMKFYAKNNPSATASMARTTNVSPPPARAATNTPVAPPPDASATEEKTADNKAAENAQVNAVAAIQSVSRLQQQVNAVSTETVRMRQKMLDDGEFPSALNSDMERYA
jgi:small-conductance mechanosensitive channel